MKEKCLSSPAFPWVCSSLCEDMSLIWSFIGAVSVVENIGPKKKKLKKRKYRSWGSWGQRCLDLNPDSVTCQLADLGQVTSSL